VERNPLSASLLILWLHLGHASSLWSVEHGPASLHVQEGESTNFTCSFPSSSSYAFHWFRWGSAQSPEKLFAVTLNGDGKEEDGRYSVNFQKAENSISLTISALQLEDSAKYFCALYGDTVLEIIGEAEQKPQSSGGEIPRVAGPKLKHTPVDPRQEVVVLWLLHLWSG
uniref:Ig-like domain-containing protein n=1 Tax=Catagonus wagneri TaxID=51154 RepID=A0A8C3VVU2_9CETA